MSIFNTRLAFLARGEASVPCPHGADAEPQRRAIVGKKHVEVSPGQWGWKPTEEPYEAAYHHDLVRACKDGDLWPANKETAEACGVDFDPLFGLAPPVQPDATPTPSAPTDGGRTADEPGDSDTKTILDGKTLQASPDSQ